MVRTRMHRLDLHDRVEHRVDGLPATDAVHRVLPGHHRQPGACIDIAGELLDNNLEALQRAGWDIRSIERAEINEAFAAIAIVVARELGLPEDIVNVEGGAVAHGHPIGATGAVLTTKLIHSMRRDGLTRGLVTLCIGGGQGIALAIEVLR